MTQPINTGDIKLKSDLNDKSFPNKGKQTLIKPIANLFQTGLKFLTVNNLCDKKTAALSHQGLTSIQAMSHLIEQQPFTLCSSQWHKSIKAIAFLIHALLLDQRPKEAKAILIAGNSCRVVHHLVQEVQAGKLKEALCSGLDLTARMSQIILLCSHSKTLKVLTSFLKLIHLLVNLTVQEAKREGSEGLKILTALSKLFLSYTKIPSVKLLISLTKSAKILLSVQKEWTHDDKLATSQKLAKLFLFFSQAAQNGNQLFTSKPQALYTL